MRMYWIIWAPQLAFVGVIGPPAFGVNNLNFLVFYEARLLCVLLFIPLLRLGLRSSGVATDHSYHFTQAKNSSSLLNSFR